MLTLPKLVRRGAKPYVALRREVDIPFGRAVDATMPAVQRFLTERGIERHGPALFRYNTIRMPHLEIEFGFQLQRAVPGGEDVISGRLPAGRYVTLTHFGHYRNLIQATAVLIGWAKLSGHKFDSVKRRGGEHFAARFELYPNGPMDEPDPDRWETQIFIKVKD
jgi:effector-binding domain-containing protein